MSLLSNVRARVPFAYLVTPAAIFMVSTMIVNGANYGYNLTLGQLLSPAQFAEAGLMITLFLIASFVAMTFQLVSTKFTVDLQGLQKVAFQRWFLRMSLVIGGILMVVLLAFSDTIATFFHLSGIWPIVISALMMPVYFHMSVKRGSLQGEEQFLTLSGSYQAEMIIRVLLTFGLFFLIGLPIDLLVSLAILGSVIVADLIIPSSYQSTKSTVSLPIKRIMMFLGLTISYEGAQILINYSDILMVKHYFDAKTAGLYTSMALVGRMIYFMTWMVVMVLIPRVLRKKQAGEAYQKLLVSYFLIIMVFSSLLILVAYLFAYEIVNVLFGASYAAVAPLIWQYGLATMLFALSNILVYYFLSMEVRLPVFIAIIFGLLQVTLFYFFHTSLSQMILVQIMNMGCLLAVMLCLFLYKESAYFFTKS